MNEFTYQPIHPQPSDWQFAEYQRLIDYLTKNINRQLGIPAHIFYGQQDLTIKNRLGFEATIRLSRRLSNRIRVKTRCRTRRDSHRRKYYQQLNRR